MKFSLVKCRVRQIPFFFGKCFKKTLKVQSFRLIMENNFIQMSALAGHAVAYTIGSIFKHIIDFVQLYFTNGFTNIVLQSVNCLWLVGVTLIFDGTPQIIVQRWQTAAPSWPNDINSAAYLQNRAQNIECSFLLKPNAANILLFNFCEQNFIQHGPITITIDCNGFSLRIFRRKMAQLCLWTKICAKQGLV